MKRFVLPILFCLLSISFSLASSITDGTGNYTYKIENGKAVITSYVGKGTVISIPTTLDGYEVSTINALIGQNSTVTDIFIPSSITNLKNVSNNSSNLKSVVLGTGNLTLTGTPFNISSTYLYSQQLDNIITLSSCSLSSSELTGLSDNYLRETKPITISLQNSNMQAQMFLYKTSLASGVTIGETRFRYLISALCKGGIDIASIRCVDMRNMSIDNTSQNTVSFDFSTFNPAEMLLNEYGAFAQVVISDETTYTYTPSTYTIDDSRNFYAPYADLTTTINYTRSNTSAWNSVCLPFDITESTFPEGTQIFKFTSADNDKITLQRVANTSEIIAAGTPCYIYSTDNSWTLQLENTTISSSVNAKSVSYDSQWELIGSFTEQTIGAGMYKLNSAGTAFGKTTSDDAKVYPFRCYLKNTNSNSGAAPRIVINDSEESISIITEDQSQRPAKLYDLMGRPRKEGSAGIFIRSNR